MRSISVRVPSSTSNMGPGFDTLGLALKLYNTVTVHLRIESEPAQTPPLEGMILETVEYFKTKNPVQELDWERLEVQIAGDIPISRGLGSSVTVRLGILLALTELVHALGLAPGCSREVVLDWVIELEGHPDNAVASCLGGMGICSRRSRGGFGYTRLPVGPELQWVALVPELELSTEAARKLLPKEVPFRHAVENMQNAARLAVCLGTGRYEELEGLFSDHLHQPYRQVLIPGFQEILESSRKVGALGGFLSGAGSTLMAVVLKRSGNAEAVGDAMLRTAKLHGLSARVITLEADNEGARVI